MRFNSAKEWKNYGLNTHSLYLKNHHFRKWINKKEIYIFNFSSLKDEGIKAIISGMEDAIKTARLHFKIKKIEKSIFQMDFSKPKINSSEILKMVVQERKQNHKENASVFIFDKPIKSQDSVIKDGEALTYVPEGIIFFTFEPSINYSRKFLRQRAKHESLHLLGLNFHHEDAKVKGYKHDVLCNMEYNAPTQSLCLKCKDGLISFWKGIEHATKGQFMKI